MSLQFLLERRSVVAKQLEEPGPDGEQIIELVRAAIRVPDHKALAPWRFLVFAGEARAEFGREIAAIYERNQDAEYKDRLVDQERLRFLRAPVVIGVVSSPVDSATVPLSEQLLSAGAACQNILHAARAMGYAGQWITEWVAYDAQVHKLLRLRDKETVAGFIYLGSASHQPGERPRTTPDKVMTYWNGAPDKDLTPDGQPSTAEQG